MKSLELYISHVQHLRSNIQRSLHNQIEEENENEWLAVCIALNWPFLGKAEDEWRY